MRNIVLLMLMSTQVLIGQYKKEKEALDFIDSLKNGTSIKFHAIANNYMLTDLDNDSIFEVVEITNKIEKDNPGFLLIEISSAFDYHQIYAYDKNLDNYILVTLSNFKVYQIERKFYYRAWFHFFSNPTNTAPHLESLINENKEYFLKELEELIKSVST